MNAPAALSAADKAVEARAGVDMLRLPQIGDRIPARALKAAGDGTVTISDVDLCKVGTFYGIFGAVSLVDADLDAMVQRFHNLRDAGIFTPPMRLDHSFSVLSVVGEFTDLSTYERVDTDGISKLFLRGDVRLTGSVDYTPAQIVDAIKRGALRNRSSELGWYETNNGVEFPLVFYGCAFVDIPAVEGLEPIELRRAALTRSNPHSVLNLEETQTMLTAAQRARLAELRAIAPDQLTDELQGELGQLVALEAAGGETPPETDAGDGGEGDGDGDGDGGTEDNEGGDPSGVAGGTTTSDPNTPTQPDAGEGDGGNANAAGDGTDTGAGGNDDGADASAQGQQGGQTTPPGTAPAPTGAPAAEVTELARLRQQVATMRQDAANERIATFRTRGAIVADNEEAAVALLSHDDDNVRRMAGTLLEGLSTRVSLGRRQGQQTTTPGTNAGQGGAVMFHAGMPSEEAGALWAELSSEDREKRSDEWAAYLAARRETGDRS